MVAPVVAAVVLRIVRRPTWWVAVTGLALVVAVLVGATTTIELGFAPMHERNARVTDDAAR